MDKFKYFRIQNFKIIEDLTIELEENTFVGIMGLNDIGKSCVGQAISILFYNNVARGINDYIRDGAQEFSIEAGMYSGNIVRLVRGRHNFYELTRPDGTTEKWTKLERSVPEEIQKIFNLYWDPVSKTSLNIRSIENPLFMIYTSNADNYSIMQHVIKATDIPKALALANDDINEKRRELANISYDISTKVEEINKLTVLDMENVENAMDMLDTAYSELEKIKKVTELIEELESKKVDTFNADELNNVMLQVNEHLEIARIADNIVRTRLEGNKIEVSSVGFDNLRTQCEQILDTAAKLGLLAKVMKDMGRIDKLQLPECDYAGNREKIENALKLIQSCDLLALLSAKKEKIDSLSLKIKENEAVLGTDLDGAIKKTQFMANLLDASDKLVETRKKVNEITAEISGLRGEYDKEFDNLGICENCKPIIKQLNSVSC